MKPRRWKEDLFNLIDMIYGVEVEVLYFCPSYDPLINVRASQIVEQAVVDFGRKNNYSIRLVITTSIPKSKTEFFPCPF